MSSLDPYYGAAQCGWSVNPLNWCVVQEIRDVVESPTVSSTDTVTGYARAIGYQQAAAAAGNHNLVGLEPGIFATPANDGSDAWARIAYWTAVGAREVSDDYARALLLGWSSYALSRAIPGDVWDRSIGKLPGFWTYASGVYPWTWGAIQALQNYGATQAAESLKLVSQGAFWWWVVRTAGATAGLAAVGAAAWWWYVGIPPRDLLRGLRR